MSDSDVINPVRFIDFQRKQENIKNVLDAVEREYSKNISPEPVQKRRSVTITNQTTQGLKLFTKYGKEESIFRKPYTPPPRIMNKECIPDFKLNPHKWTKYSLSDVTADQVSDVSNTNIALAFIKMIKKRKVDSEMDIDSNNPEDKHVFRKPNNKSGIPSNVSETKNKTTFIGNKLVMPEYIVGCKQQKKPKRAVNPLNTQGCNTKPVILHHFTEFEDEN